MADLGAEDFNRQVIYRRLRCRLREQVESSHRRSHNGSVSYTKSVNDADHCGSGLAREEALKFTESLKPAHKKGRDPLDRGLFIALD
jgi:hypothetical protein